MAYLPDLPIMKSDLQYREKWVLWVLKFHIGQNDSTWVSHTTLARRSSLSISSVKRALLQLIAEGWVTMEQGKDKGKTNIYRLNKDKFSLQKVGLCDLPLGQCDLPPQVCVTYPLGQCDLHKNTNKNTIKETSKKTQSEIEKPSSVAEVLSGKFKKNPKTEEKNTINSMINNFRNFIKTEFNLPAKITQKDKAYFYAMKKKVDSEINCNFLLMEVLKDWEGFNYYILKLTGEQCKGTLPQPSFIAANFELVQPWLENNKSHKPTLAKNSSLDAIPKKEKTGAKLPMDSLSEEELKAEEKKKHLEEILALEEGGD